MKSKIPFLLAMVLSLGTFAQVPQKINYQAVARNSIGSLVTDSQVGIQVSIYNSATDELVYRETHETNTNRFGLFSLKIGSGDPVEGKFEQIAWADGEMFINEAHW